jgi:predicted dehydrogenase
MKILIIGLGSIAKKHIEALQSLEVDSTIFALRSNSNADAIEGVTNLFDIEETQVCFDFAIISNPTYLHFEFIKLLTIKGIPLFIEKPALDSLKGSKELVNLINKKKIITYVACNLRFHPCIDYLRERLNKDNLKVNELNVYCGSYLPDWRPGKNFREIYSAKSKMGGGVHLDLFHEIDYTTWLFGFPLRSNALLRSKSTLNIDAVDYANYILEYENFTASIVLNYFRKTAKRQIEIVFENDTWVVDLINNTIINEVGVVIYSVDNYLVKETYKEQLSYFVNCLISKEIPMNSLEESLVNLKICLNNE